LTDEVARYRKTRKPVIGQKFPPLPAVFLAHGGPVDFKVVSPAGEFKAVITHFTGFPG
jgi:hypothetical protein